MVTLEEEQKVEWEEPEETFFCVLLLTHNNEVGYSFFYSVESVLKQKYSSFRLAVLDNASKDWTARALRRHLMRLEAGERKKVYLHSVREELAEGELIYFGGRHFCQPGEVMIIMEAGEEMVG